MLLLRRFLYGWLALSLVLAIHPASGQEPGEDNPVPEKRSGKSITSLPSITPAIHNAMQSRAYDDAIKLIQKELADDAVQAPDYLRYLQGIAQTEAKKYDAALATLEKLELDFPQSEWISRARFGRAHVFVMQRQYIDAGAIYQQEAERLLSRGRKDDLAKIYLEFADRYFQGIPAADASQKKEPDYQQALTYYAEAIKLGPTIKLQQQVDFRIARCQEELKNHDDAIKSYATFIEQHCGTNPLSRTAAPHSLQVEAAFRLGSVQLAAGKNTQARKTLQDLISNWSDTDDDVVDDADREVISSHVAHAEYLLSHSYGLPRPSSIGNLELGVAIAEKFLTNYPDHELAPKAELEIAEAYWRHNRHQQAVARLQSLIDSPRYQDSQHIPEARQALGKELLAQGLYDEAIAAWKSFLEKHPTDPRWPKVQKSIVDAEYAKAATYRSKKEYASARKTWQTFLNKYPLDPRAPNILLQFGQMKFAEAAEIQAQRITESLEKGESAQSVVINDECRTLFEAAITDWRRVVTKYPGNAAASHASLLIGITLEDRLQKLKEALASYKNVTGPFEERARQRTKRLTTPQLTLATERKFRSNEKPRIKITTRNLKEVTVRVYHVDMTDYFRKMHLASGLETLDIALIDPDEQFTHAVDSYKDYQSVDGDIQLPIEGVGVTAVTVSSEKLEATTMVVVSDLDMVVKSSRNELFVFAENMLTKKPADGVSILVSDGATVFAEQLTGKDGILQKTFDELKSVTDLRVFAVQEGHMASTVNNLNGLDFAVVLAPRGYLYTDRPAYRSGQLVNIKGILRWVDEDRFTYTPGEKMKLVIYDPAGRRLHSTDVALNHYGTINSNFILPQSAPLGNYRVVIHRKSLGDDDTAGSLSIDTQFKVAQYQLEPVQIDASFDKSVYYRGETVKATLSLKYYYGTPLRGETLTYQFGDNDQIRTAKTDDDGNIEVEFETQQLSESQPIKLNVKYPERGISSQKVAYLATRGFDVTASTLRDVFVTGESFDAIFKAGDPAGNPVETALEVQVFHQTVTQGSSVERLIQTHKLNTDKQSGEASQTLSLSEGGIYVIRATGTDQFGNRVSGQNRVFVSGNKDSQRLHILADRLQFNVGDNANVNLHWREKPALALVTFEGASVLDYRLVQLKEGDNPLTLPMASEYAPNFVLSVAVMQQNRFHHAKSEFRVAQELRITLKPSDKELQPGDDLNVQIEVTDPQGKPVKAELSLALVQSNMLNSYGDVQQAINAFFGQGSRKSSVRQSTSCTFAYQPKTRGVSEFLLAEADRRSTLEREVRALAELNQRNSVNLQANINAGASVVLGDEDGDSPMGWGLEADFHAPSVAGQPIVGDFAVAGELRRQRGATQTRQELRTRSVPITRYRTEIREGRQVRIPYTEQVTQNYSIAVPYTEQVEQSSNAQVPQGWEQIGRSSQMQSYPTNLSLVVSSGAEIVDHTMPQSLSNQTQGQSPDRQQNGTVRFDEQFQYRWFDSRETTMNAITGNGKFLAVNGRGQLAVQELARAEGLELLPAMADAETAFWDPTIVTDDAGQATITITMPARSTAWRLQAKGINGKTLAGEATVDLITKKELFGEMKLPLAFTVGDKASVPVEIHNSLPGARSIKVVFKAALGDKSTEQSKTIEVPGPGIYALSFDIAIDEAAEAVFTLNISGSDESNDNSSRTVAVVPYGFPVYETVSGTASQGTVALVDFDPQLDVDGAALDILIGASVNRSLLNSVIGSEPIPFFNCGLTVPSATERSISDLLGGLELLQMIGDARDANTPEAQAVAGKITAGVTQLIASQNDKGGWSWNGFSEASDPNPYLSSRAMWAIAAARQGGFTVPAESWEKGKAYLKSAFASAGQSDLECQTVLLHAMAECDCGDFAYANRLYRERNRLSPSGLTHLVLTLAAMKHKAMAVELIDLIKIPVGSETMTAEARQLTPPWLRNRVELQALYFLALQEIAPSHPNNSQLAKTLLGSRIGSRWPIEKTNGPAIAALARWHSHTRHVEEKFTLTVSVNDHDIETFTVDPSKEGQRRIAISADLLNTDKPQRIEFDLQGRTTFSYSAVLTGFVAASKIKATTKQWTVSRRYEPAQRLSDGRTVPRGFDVVDGSYRTYTNPLTQLPVGDRGEVTLSPRRHQTTGRVGEQYDYLVLTESIPAGCTILESSITGAFERYAIEPGEIVFHIGDRRHPGDIRYTLLGYVPGEYRTGQSILRSFYEPSQFAIATTKNLQVLKSTEKTSDQYRLTPDELYYLGQREFEKSNFTAAHAHLTNLYDCWRLDSDKHRNAVRWLFLSSLSENDHADTVKYFEVLKEKFPDVEISFEDILTVAKSYRELGEYERSYLVYRATVQGSFERESQVAGFLNARGEFARSVEAMERVLRDYPAESYVATATYALAQETYRRAPSAADDVKLKEAELTRVHLIQGAIEMLDHFVTNWPEDPSNDQASFALATALIDLETFDAAISRCEKYAKRYPDSRLLDSFWYMIGYSHFELEQPQDALKMCRKVADATFPASEGRGIRRAENRWEATYIMGQIYHSLGDAANAITEYAKVKQRFADAAEAISFFSRKEISLDEITTIKPSDPKKVQLSFRNLSEAAIKVYRIDLMKFGLMQRNLDRITAINLAGIRPYHEETVPLGDGKDFRDRTIDLTMPLTEEGAYLIVCRSENLYASGLALVSPLKLMVQEEKVSGRVRVSVKETANDQFVSDVHVKVIGSANDDFNSGDTDLRGLFIADDVKGTSTVIAVSNKNRYAFYRGTVPLQNVTPATKVRPSANSNDPFGGPDNPFGEDEEASAPSKGVSKPGSKGGLRDNLFRQNGIFQMEQKGNYDNLLNNDRRGIKSKEAY
ncbi:tetratricopeptide repeat protein [Planctomycetes bacterium K23_9]|uniref:Tol-pal system protein YbgF n=1 Tax=Stieleria marina TaxID=1930275 RepID=A0A517P0T5_9BACT|nr:tol-pal system protein YbgF [Planctomycetes bacterium K23_9]